MSSSHGGKREGAGRKPTPFISKKVTLHFETEQEYQSLLERITNPRQRTLILTVRGLQRKYGNFKNMAKNRTGKHRKGY